jgi:hypothetical protein
MTGDRMSSSLVSRIGADHKTLYKGREYLWLIEQSAKHFSDTIAGTDKRLKISRVDSLIYR